MKDKSNVNPNGKATFYAVLYNDFRKAALDCGYALSLHGSMINDMDMIAVPWVIDAKKPDELVASISNCIGRTVWSNDHTVIKEIRPFGRLIYTMSIMGDWYIDLSVIPPSNENKKFKMKNYYLEIDKEGQMFDFKSFYQSTANYLPDNARIVEVGLNNGKSAIFLAEYLYNINKPIDRFIGIDNCSYGGQEQRNEIMTNIMKAGVGIEFLEMSSLDASCKFPGNYLDFLFIDSSHQYEQTRAEIILWYQKIKDGGILAGHDYYEYEEVKRAVDELIPKEHLEIIETENGFGIWKIKKDWQWALNY